MKHTYTRTIKILSVICILLFARNTNAQTNYSFLQSTATYTPLSVFTTVATATTDSAGGAATSLNSLITTLPNGTIPFTFNYNGTGYTGCSISTNGFLTFGTTAPSTTNTNPISSTAAYAGAVAAFGRDIIGTYRVANPGDADTIATIRYGVTGTTPNRKFIVEWNNFRPTGTAPSGTGPNFSFQIRLLEGSNNCEIAYGPFTGGTWPNSSAQVGIRGATNTVFLNRALTSGQPWTATTAGGVNTAGIAYTNANLPAPGLVFTYSAPCPAPTTLALVDLKSTSVKLRWNSGLSGSIPGAQYIVEWGPAGFVQGTGTLVTTTDTFLLLSSLTTGASYQYYVRRDCSPSGNGFSAFVGPKSFTTGVIGEDCADAQLVSVASGLATCAFTTVTSGSSQNGPNALCSDSQNGNYPDDDRWLKFVAPGNGKKIVVKTNAGTVADWVMEVWNTCPGGGGYAVKCSDDVNASMPEITLCQNEYTPGQTYYIRAWTYSQSANGNMTLCVYEDSPCPIPPAYDDCISAASFPINPVLSCPGNELTFTTLFATASGAGSTTNGANLPTCDGSTPINDVWLTFNSGSTGDFTVTFGLGTATALKAQLVFECGTGGFEIMCLGNAVGTYTVSGLNPSANYYFRVWSPVGQSGTFTVCAQDLCDDAKATISGASTICTTGVAQLRVDLTGLAPWTVTYTNGVSNFNFTTSTTPYFINVSPTVSTFYNLVSVSSPICFGSVSGVASVSVVPPPIVTLAPFTSTVCSNAIVTLSGGSPIGGAYSGTGVSGNQFNGSIAGVGTHTITYTYGVGNGCQRSASQPITVIAGPSVASFSPGVSPVGSTVTITGTGFTNVNAVKFNTTNAIVFSVVNSTTITAVVPSGATTGYITVFTSNGCSSQSMTTFGVGNLPNLNLTVKAFIEGYYLGGGLMAAVIDPIGLPTKFDSVTVELRGTVSPFVLVSAKNGLMNTDGTVTVSFNSALANSSYYIVLKGRNSVETWSKNPKLLISGNNIYNFATGTGGSLRTMAPGNQGSSPIENSIKQEKPEHPE